MLTVELNGNSITNLVISYERALSLCDGIGTVSLTILPPLFSFTTWDEIEVWEDGNKKGLFYISSFEELEDSSYKLICQDGSKRLNDYYVDDIIETSEITNTKDWIIYFLDLAGVNYVFDTLEDGHSLPEDSTFGPDQVLNIIEPLLMENGWFLFFDDSGIAHITPVSLDPESPVATIDVERIITLTSRIDDAKARNRVVVWNPVKGYIAEATASTSWQIDSNDLRSVGITSSYIRNDYHAQLIANRILQVFRDPEHTKVIEIEGEVNVLLADAVRIRSPYFTGNGVVTTINVRFDKSGFITTLTLDEKCPRLVGIFEYAGYVYIGTWGAGIWRKPLSGSTWESYSAGLGNLEIIDLSIANGIFACVANNGYLYIREFSDSSWRLYSTPIFTDQDTVSYSNAIATACKVDVNTGDIYATYSAVGVIEFRSWIEQLNIFGTHIGSQQVQYQDNQDYWSYDLDKNNLNSILSAYTGNQIPYRPSTNVIKPSFPVYRMNVAIDGQNRCSGPPVGTDIDMLDGFIETFKWGGGTNMASPIVVYEEKIFFLENRKFTYINTTTHPSVRRDWYVPIDTSGGVAGGLYGILSRSQSGTIFDFVRVKNTPGSIGEPSSPGLYLIYTLEHYRMTFDNIDLHALVAFEQFPTIVMFREGGSSQYPYESNASNYDPLKLPMYHNGKIAFFWAGLFNNDAYGSLSLVKNYNFKSATYDIFSRQFTKSGTLTWPGTPSPGTSGIVFDVQGPFPNVSLSLHQEESNTAIWLINSNMINGSGPSAGIFYYSHAFNTNFVVERIQHGITSSWLYPWIHSLNGNQFVKLTSFTKSTREYTFRFQYAYKAFLTDYYLCNGLYFTRDTEERQKYGVFSMKFDGSLGVIFDELDVFNGVRYENVCDFEITDSLDYGPQGFGYNKAPIADLNLEFGSPRYTYGSTLMDATQINNPLGTLLVGGTPIVPAHRDVSHQAYFNLDLCDYYGRRFYVVDNNLFKIYGFNLDDATLETTIINVPALTISQSHMMVGNYIFSTNGYRNGGDFVIFDTSLWYIRVTSNHTFVTGGGGFTLLEVSDYRRNVEATTDGYDSTFTLPLPSGGLPGGIIGALNPGAFLTNFYRSDLSEVSVAPFFGVNDVKVPYIIASGFYTISGEVGLIGDVAIIASGNVMYAKQLPFYDQLFDNYHIVVLSSGGSISHLEVSNTFELPFLFYSVTNGSGTASEFYQRNPEEVFFADYSSGLPSSDITIIRLDDTL